MLDLVHKILYTGIGFAVLTEQKAQELVAELEAKGEELSADEVHRQMLERDRNDQTRELAPLQPAADAVIVDSSNLQVAEVVQLMLEHIETKLR